MVSNLDLDKHNFALRLIVCPKNEKKVMEIVHKYLGEVFIRLQFGYELGIPNLGRVVL